MNNRKAAAEKVKAKYKSSWMFSRRVKENLLSAIVAKRIEEPGAAYLEEVRSGEDEGGARQEIDPECAAVFAAFWKFAQMTREEYAMMHRETLGAAVMAAVHGSDHEGRGAE